MNGRKLEDVFREWTFLAVAAAIVAAGAGLAQAQLVFVNAEDDFGGNPNVNLSCAAGGPLSNCVDINPGAVVGDNRWGFIETGAPAGGVANLYESNTEDAPELRMTVAAPNGTYEAYAVFWADVNVQFLIRAGLTSSPGGNTLFGRTTGGGATASLFGASAIWATPPDDNPNVNNSDDNDNDATNIINPLTGANPFVEHVPGGGGGTRMYLAPLGQVTAAGGTGFNVFIDDLPSTNDQNRAQFEGVAYVAAGTDAFLEATIDRATGNLTVLNTTGTALNISRYAISSPAGALDPAQWDSISVGGNASISETDAWTIGTNGAVVSGNWLLAENESGGANGAQLAATTGAFNLGNVWVKSPFEDALVSLELTGGQKVQLLPTYTGDTYDVGDFDADGDVDFDDYSVLIGNLHVPVAAGLTQSQRYKLGDLNNSGTVDRNDFFSFRTAYFAANPGSGEAAWNAMITGGVPEPNTLMLFALAGGLSFSVARRRSNARFQVLQRGVSGKLQCGNRGGRLIAVTAAMLGAVLATPSSAEDVVGWLPYQGNMVNLTGADTNSPVYGNGAANNIDNSGIYGSLQTPIVLNPSEEAVLRGRVQILGHTGANREFRWGMWKKVVQPTNPNTNPTTGWLGYMALNGAGAGTGRLEAKNPDGDFQNGIFISDFGGGSIAQFSGPAPAGCSPLEDGSCNQPGQRYFLLAENAPQNNSGFANNVWYTFEIRVGRYGDNENTVSGSLVADAAPAIGDYNSDGTVDAADYTVWRDNLGTGFALPNRDPANTGNVSQADYDSWNANFGATGASPYVFNIGGGLDFNGNPPTDPVNNPEGTYTPHVTFEFDRVGFLFGGALDADQAIFDSVQINKQTIETLDLLVNTTTGATTVRNNLPASFDINYYEITSATNSLRKTGGWTSLDSTEGGDPIGIGWDEAGGSGDGILSEGNLTGAITLNQSGSFSLGNAFKTVANGGTQGTQDLRLFVGLTNGNVLRGTVTYTNSGSAAGVPEPTTCGLLLVGGLGVLGRWRRS